MKFLAVDLSSVYAVQWHASAAEGVNYAADKTVEKVRRMAGAYHRVAVCIDSPKSWRRDKFGDYKSSRPKKEEAYVYHLRRSQELLAGDGYALLGAEGYEADDMIAAVVIGYTEDEVDILTADKDLLQLVNGRVRLVSHQTGEIRDPAWLAEKWEITPEQVPCYLALIGDKSDDLPGVDGCGPKLAARLLQRWHDLEGIHETLTHKATEIRSMSGVGVAKVSKLLEGFNRAYPNVFDVRELVRLKPPQGFKELCAILEKEQRPVNTVIDYEEEELAMVEEEEDSVPPPTESGEQVPQARVSQPAAKGEAVDFEPGKALAVRAPGWSSSLEPTTLREAFKFAQVALGSRLFAGYGSADQIFCVIAAGREMGLRAMESLRSFHVISGKPVLSAQALMGLCLRHPDCEMFRVVASESNGEQAVVEVKRRGWPTCERYTWTLKEAQAAQLTGKDIWKKYGRSMLVNRCIAEAARFSFPDALGNVYIAEDFGEHAA
jgi:5'-3' exonuclease